MTESQSTTEDEQNPLDVIEPDDPAETFPETMAERERWMLRSADEKLPLAPWKTGALYAVSWGSQLDEDERPETTLDEAQNWYNEQHVFGSMPPSEVTNAEYQYILPHEPRQRGNIVFFDFDDVRDDETGYVVPEARELLDRLDSWTEVSSSGQGLHVFVVGQLPDGASDLKFELDTDERPAGDPPEVEVYSTGRNVALTGRRVANYSESIEDGQDVIEDLFDEHYEEDRSANELHELRSVETSSTDADDISPYFEQRVTDIVTIPDAHAVGQENRGSHPQHGSSNGNNFAFDGGGRWHCFRHGSGGGALELVAVMEGIIDCEDAEQGCLSLIDDRTYAELCMVARDDYGFPEDAKPPYRALVGVGKEVDLIDESNERLGDMYDIVHEIYDDNTWDDLV